MFMSEKISCSLSHIKTEISSDLSSYGFRKIKKNKCSDINTCLTDSHLGLNMCWEDTVELQGKKKKEKKIQWRQSEVKVLKISDQMFLCDHAWNEEPEKGHNL